MTAPIRASAMLRTAEKLAGVGAGPGRPATSDLRRATSTAYYALFHQLTRHGVLSVLPSADDSEIAHCARWFTHQAFRRVAMVVTVAADPTKTVRKEDRCSAFVLRTSGQRRLLTVAESFVELQDARHAADYDNEYSPVRAVALDHVITARTAIEATGAMWALHRPDAWNAEADAYRRFLLLCLMQSGGPRSR